MRKTHERVFKPDRGASERQTLRGGRSWPSERKLGAGASKEGKTTAVKVAGIRSGGTVPNRGEVEQDAVQKLHSSGTPESCSWWPVES